MRLAGMVSGVGIMLVLTSSAAQADQFHYHNFLMGTRAVGLGGAFGAVADDASGIYYNPAGLAFALSNDISGSANAYYQKKTTYKDTLCGDDFKEESGGSIPSFFGGLQKMDKLMSGLVTAFGIYTVDSDLKDQNTFIENKECPGTTIGRYHRASNARASTFFAGLAAARRFTSNVSFGLGLNYFNVDELVQEYQDAQQSGSQRSASGAVVNFWQVLGSNIRERLAVHGVQAVLGTQASLPNNITAGLTLKVATIASQKLELDSEVRTNTLSDDAYKQMGNSAVAGQVSERLTKSKSKKPIGSWPSELRLGLGWFATTSILWTFDVIHHTASNNGEQIAQLGSRPRYQRDAVTNFATGFEYYMMPSLPLRVGVFTNNDARPEVNQPPEDIKNRCSSEDLSASEKKRYCGQADHVDYIGESLFIAWVQPNSQIAAGVVLQQGKGKAQKLGDHNVQTVTAASNTFAFSATHNF